MSTAALEAAIADGLSMTAADDWRPLRVVVADDHPLFRRGLARAIARSPELELVGEGVDGADALALVDALEPDIVVLDQRMPHLTGLQVAAALAQRPLPSRPAVVLLTAFDDDELRRRAELVGVLHVAKSETPAAIIEAIEVAVVEQPLPDTAA